MKMIKERRRKLLTKRRNEKKEDAQRGRTELLSRVKQSQWYLQRNRITWCTPVKREGLLAATLRAEKKTAISKLHRLESLSKITIGFGGSSQGVKNLKKNCRNLSEKYGFSYFDNIFQNFYPLTGTPKNNRWDKIFWTNLGFGAFFF